MISEADSLKFFFLKSSGELTIAFGDISDSTLVDISTQKPSVPTGVLWFDIAILTLLIIIFVKGFEK